MNSKLSDEIPALGVIQDVRVWKMPCHSDVRGRLFKAYTTSETEIFPTPFETFEHFFTESRKNVFRGMHFQGEPHAVSKIISIVQGAALDFLLDIRKGSTTYGMLQIVELSGATPSSIFIPCGVAHGYLALQEQTIISYRLDGPFCANCDGGFSGEIVSSYLPISISETIQSQRDLELMSLSKFEYKSVCESLRDIES